MYFLCSSNSSRINEEEVKQQYEAEIHQLKQTIQILQQTDVQSHGQKTG